MKLNYMGHILSQTLLVMVSKRISFQSFFYIKLSPLCRSSKGMTLPEVLLAAFILTTAIAGTLMFFSQAMVAAELSRDLTLATSHAEYILEEMQEADTLGEIVTKDWNQFVLDKGLSTLSGESIVVKLTNEFSNPVDVQVVVNWTRGGRSNKVTLDTKITK